MAYALGATRAYGYGIRPYASGLGHMTVDVFGKDTFPTLQVHSRAR